MAWTATWTDPAELDEASIDHAHDLREAINERYDIANALEDPAVTLTKPTMCTDNGTLHLWTKATIRDQVTTALAALAPSFCDTTDSVTAGSAIGRWSNVGDIITNGLSETAETKPGELDADDFAWWSQQKRVLDLMKWTRQDLTINDFTGEDSRTGTGGSWAAAVSSWNSASWVSAAGTNPNHYAAEASGTFQIVRRRANVEVTSSGFDYPTISNDWEVTPSTRQPKKTWDYVELFLNDGGTYENNDFTTGGDLTYGIIHSATVENTHQNFISLGGGLYNLPENDNSTTFDFGDSASVTATQPSTGVQQGWQALGGIYILYKWDVANGLNKVA